MSPGRSHIDMDGALSAVLDDMRLSLDELSGVLENEREALLSGDVAGIDQAGSRKYALMQQLEQLDAERVQLGLAAPDVALALDDRWQALLKTLRACRDKNQHNGQVVGQRLGSVRRALAILTGQDADSGVYGRSGALQNRSRSQTLAEA